MQLASAANDAVQFLRHQTSVKSEAESEAQKPDPYSMIYLSEHGILQFPRKYCNLAC
jgi:hypothetical protein